MGGTVQCGPCCVTLACGYCNNPDLLNQEVSVTLSGFSGICNKTVLNVAFSGSDVTDVVDSAGVNGTFLLKFQSGLQPPPGFAQICWWGGGGLATGTETTVYHNGFPPVTNTVPAGPHVWFGILHPPSALQFQVYMTFGFNYCAMSALWQTDIIPVDPSKGMDCLNITSALNLNSGSSFGSMGSASVP